MTDTRRENVRDAIGFSILLIIGLLALLFLPALMEGTQ